MSMRRVVKTGTRSGRFVPRVEALEDRQLLTSYTYSYSGSLYITGDNKADVISIVDDGTNAPGNLKLTFNGATSSESATSVSIDTKGGKDQVTYTLSGNLTSIRGILVKLGSGNDKFNLQAVSGDAQAFSQLVLNAYGEAGNDTISATMAGSLGAFGGLVPVGLFRGTRIPFGGGAQVDFLLRGGSGNDVLNVDVTGNLLPTARLDIDAHGEGDVDHVNISYQGILGGTLGIDGEADFPDSPSLVLPAARNKSHPGGRNSVIAGINLAEGSNGLVTGANGGDVARVVGGADKDGLQFVIDNFGTAQVNAMIDGGASKDDCHYTDQVAVQNC